MTYREATPDDAPKLIVLAELFLRETAYGELLRTQPRHIETMIGLVFRHGVIFVAELGDQIVGMLAIVIVPHPLTGSSYADEVVWYVDPNHRGGQVGPRLLGLAEDFATRCRVPMVKLVAPHDSQVGLFLARRGYQAVETAFVRKLTVEE